MAIPPSFIQELIARADVVEVVGRYVQLKKSGANYSGLCPFHGEKTPSFSVSPTKQFFHCFGCGKTGNVLTFMMEHTGVGFIDAVKDLAQTFGLQVPEDERSPAERARDAQVKTQQTSLTELLAKAANAYKEQLKASPRAIDYLKNRGLSGEIAAQYGMGYSPEGWRSLASVFPDYDDAQLVTSGLVIEKVDDDNPHAEAKKYDRFRDRIMFPIRNVKGETIGFGGRVLDKGEPKYLNSPETPVFSKGRELYGLFEARSALQKAGYVLVTEGYMDVVALAQMGFPNAVATLGTACTPDHVQKLFRFTDHVVFSFDGDGAGRRAAIKALAVAIPFATDTRTAKFLTLPPEHDPDSYIRKHGADAFRRFVSDATPLSRFLIEAARDGQDLATMEGKSKFASNARPLWSALPQGALKIQLRREIASLMDIAEFELEGLWKAQTPTTYNARPEGNNYNNNSEKRPYDADIGQNSYKNKKYEGSGRFNKTKDAWNSSAGAAPGLRARGTPVSREDRALQILLTDNAAWEQLSQRQHELLCALPAPHGAVFSWLDMQMHEHGAQSWGALSQALMGQSFEGTATKLVNQMPDDILPDPAELDSILREMQRKAISAQMQAAAKAATSDPSEFERYKALAAELKALPA